MSNRRSRSAIRRVQVPVIGIILLLLLTYPPTKISASALALQSALHGGSGTFFAQQGQTSYQRGLAALQKNDPETALRELTAAELDKPDDASIHNFRGIVLVQLGRSADAEAEYRDAIHLDPKLVASYRNLGFLEWRDHHLEVARQTLQDALSLSAEDSFARYYLGRVELELHQYEAGFQDIERSGIPLPDDIDVLILAAGAHRELGQDTLATAIAMPLAARNLTASQASRLASLLVTLKQHQAAVLLLQHWTIGPHEDLNRWAALDTCLAYLLAGSYERAAAQARDLTRHAPNSQPGSTPPQAAEAWSIIGIADAYLHLSADSVGALHTAVELAPQEEEYWLNLTRELMELDRFTEAIATAIAAITIHPKSYSLQLRVGALYLAIDKYDDAERVFRRLIEAGDPLPTSSVGLAQVLLRTGRADQAVAALVSARQRLGPSFLLSYFQGLAYNRAGNPVNAASVLREALLENPASADAHRELGKTELGLSHFDESIAELQKALQLNQADPLARRLLKHAYRRSGLAQEPPDTMPPLPAPNVVGDFIPPEWQEPGAPKI